jgi:outer membrane lipoprotein-sorting protein
MIAARLFLLVVIVVFVAACAHQLTDRIAKL